MENYQNTMKWVLDDRPTLEAVKNIIPSTEIATSTWDRNTVDLKLFNTSYTTTDYAVIFIDCLRNKENDCKCQ